MNNLMDHVSVKASREMIDAALAAKSTASSAPIQEKVLSTSVRLPLSIHDALADIVYAERKRGNRISIHSLILEGVDHIIGIYNPKMTVITEGSTPPGVFPVGRWSLSANERPDLWERLIKESRPAMSITPKAFAKKENNKIPYGYCHCGCGEKTTLILSSNKRLGRVKGTPNKYLTGHNTPCDPSFQRKIHPNNQPSPAMNLSKSEYLTAYEFCALVRIGRSTFDQMRAKNIGPRAAKIGNRLLISKVDARKWIDSKVESNSNAEDVR